MKLPNDIARCTNGLCRLECLRKIPTTEEFLQLVMNKTVPLMRGEPKGRKCDFQIIKKI